MFFFDIKLFGRGINIYKSTCLCMICTKTGDCFIPVVHSFKRTQWTNQISEMKKKASRPISILMCISTIQNA